MKMKRIFALVLVIGLLAVMVIPQVQAVEWETYIDPQGRFSIDYPANWTTYCPTTDYILLSDPGFDIGCGINVGKLHDPCVPPGCIPGIQSDDVVVAEDGDTARVVLFCSTEYVATFTFKAPSSQFDSASRMYFEHMIRSIKMK